MSAIEKFSNDLLLQWQSSSKWLYLLLRPAGCMALHIISLLFDSNLLTHRIGFRTWSTTKLNTKNVWLPPEVFVPSFTLDSRHTYDHHYKGVENTYWAWYNRDDTHHVDRLTLFFLMSWNKTVINQMPIYYQEYFKLQRFTFSLNAGLNWGWNGTQNQECLKMGLFPQIHSMPHPILTMTCGWRRECWIKLQVTHILRMTTFHGLIRVIWFLTFTNLVTSLCAPKKWNYIVPRHMQ